MLASLASVSASVMSLRELENISRLPQCLAHIRPSITGHFLPCSVTRRVLALLPARDPGILDLTTHAQGSHLLAVLLKTVPDLVSLSILLDKPPESLLGFFFFFLSPFPLGAF